MVGVGRAVGEAATDASEDIRGLDREETVNVLNMIPGLNRSVNRVRHCRLHKERRARTVRHVGDLRFKGPLLQRHITLGVPEGPVPVQAWLLFHMHDLAERVDQNGFLRLDVEKAAEKRKSQPKNTHHDVEELEEAVLTGGERRF